MRESATARLRALHSALTAHAPGISAEEYGAFLFIAENEGTCQREIQDNLKTAQSSTSRHINALNGTGHGLICAELDEKSKRRNNLRLSDKGRQLLTQLTILIGCCVMLMPPVVSKPATVHDAQGRYDGCLDIRTSRCDVT